MSHEMPTRVDVTEAEMRAALRILAPDEDDNVTLGEIRAKLRAAQPPPTLVEFLTARLNDDEAGLISGWRDHFRACAALGHGGEADFPADCDCGGPERQRREFNAKRAIVDRFAATTYPDVDPAVWVVMKMTLVDLASVYAEHPDHREEWKT